MHIHGHNVQIVARGPGICSQRPPYQRHVFRQSGNINSNAQANALGFTYSSAGMPHIPMRRDRWMIAPSSYTVIRFVANNPGVWFLHCHMEWLMEAVCLSSSPFLFLLAL